MLPQHVPGRTSVEKNIVSINSLTSHLINILTMQSLGRQLDNSRLVSTSGRFEGCYMKRLRFASHIVKDELTVAAVPFYSLLMIFVASKSLYLMGGDELHGVDTLFCFLEVESGAIFRLSLIHILLLPNKSVMLLCFPWNLLHIILSLVNHFSTPFAVVFPQSTLLCV